MIFSKKPNTPAGGNLDVYAGMSGSQLDKPSKALDTLESKSRPRLPQLSRQMIHHCHFPQYLSPQRYSERASGLLTTNFQSQMWPLRLIWTTSPYFSGKHICSIILLITHAYMLMSAALTYMYDSNVNPTMRPNIVRYMERSHWFASQAFRSPLDALYHIRNFCYAACPSY